MFSAVALMDDDDEGRRACHYLTARIRNLRKYRDVFILKRRLRVGIQHPDRLESAIKAENKPWIGLDCEVEDLLSLDFLQAFVAEDPSSIKFPYKSVNDGHHFEFTRDGKARLCKWVAENALLLDLRPFVDVLRFFRAHFGLNPDGSP